MNDTVYQVRATYESIRINGDSDQSSCETPCKGPARSGLTTRRRCRLTVGVSLPRCAWIVLRLPISVRIPGPLRLRLGVRIRVANLLACGMTTISLSRAIAATSTFGVLAPAIYITLRCR